MLKAGLLLSTIAMLLASVTSAEAGFLQPVPESSGTFALLGVGLVALAALRHKLTK